MYTEVIKNAFQCEVFSYAMKKNLCLLACLFVCCLLPPAYMVQGMFIYFYSFFVNFMFVAKCWFANWFTVCLRFKYQFTFTIQHTGNVFTLPVGFNFHPLSFVRCLNALSHFMYVSYFIIVNICERFYFLFPHHIIQLSDVTNARF